MSCIMCVVRLYWTLNPVPMTAMPDFSWSDDKRCLSFMMAAPAWFTCCNLRLVEICAKYATMSTLVLILSNSTMDLWLRVADWMASRPSSSIGSKLNSSVSVDGLIWEYSLNKSSSVANGNDGFTWWDGYDLAKMSIYYATLSAIPAFSMHLGCYTLHGFSSHRISHFDWFFR